MLMYESRENSLCGSMGIFDRIAIQMTQLTNGQIYLYMSKFMLLVCIRVFQNGTFSFLRTGLLSIVDHRPE